MSIYASKTVPVNCFRKSGRYRVTVCTPELPTPARHCRLPFLLSGRLSLSGHHTPDGDGRKDAPADGHQASRGHRSLRMFENEVQIAYGGTPTMGNCDLAAVTVARRLVSPDSDGRMRLLFHSSIAWNLPPSPH